MMIVHRFSLVVSLLIISSCLVVHAKPIQGDGGADTNTFTHHTEIKRQTEPPPATAATDAGTKFKAVLQCINDELNKPATALQGGAVGDVDLEKEPPPVVVAFDTCIEKTYLTNPEAVQAANAK